jgi:toxin YoeB
MQEYIDWQNEDRKTLRKINALIADIHSNGYLNGIGKPERLKHRPAYSRHIDDANRLVYEGDAQGNVRILSCKGHYDDK